METAYDDMLQVSVILHYRFCSSLLLFFLLFCWWIPIDSPWCSSSFTDFDLEDLLLLYLHSSYSCTSCASEAACMSNVLALSLYGLPASRFEIDFHFLAFLLLW